MHIIAVPLKHLLACISRPTKKSETQERDVTAGAFGQSRGLSFACLLAYAVQLISQLANLCFGFLKHRYATVIRIVLGHVSRSHTGQNFAEIHCLRSVRIVTLSVLIGIKDFTRCSSLPFTIKNKILTHRQKSTHG